MDGIIIKGIGGFYYVETADGIIECKARGVLRNKKVTPMAGDRVDVNPDDKTIDDIKERKSALTKPPVANIDKLFIVVSATKPRPNTLLVDRLTAIAVHNNIEPIIVFNKTDLLDIDDLIAEYRKTNFTVIKACGKTGEGVEEIKRELQGNISAFTGNTGVGKSTLLNLIDPSLTLPTSEISEKLGRGKHTTRESTLIKLDADTYVADTPGFASLEALADQIILKDELDSCFPEFEPYLSSCQFYPHCSHIKDKGCAIREKAEENVEISHSRYESYIAMYEEVKDIKDWQIK